MDKLFVKQQRLPQFLDNRHMNVVRLSALHTGPLYPQRVVRPEGLSHRKIVMTPPSGIEPATFRLVAQCLNQLRHRVARVYICRTILLFGEDRNDVTFRS